MDKARQKGRRRDRTWCFAQLVPPEQEKVQQLIVVAAAVVVVVELVSVVPCTFACTCLCRTVPFEHFACTVPNLQQY